MFQLLRRKQKSYWYLSDSLDSNDDGALPCPVGQIGWKRDVTKAAASPCTRGAVEKGRESANPTGNLDNAMALQKKWTSWPNTIWEMNFDDADAEIVFFDGHP